MILKFACSATIVSVAQVIACYLNGRARLDLVEILQKKKKIRNTFLAKFIKSLTPVSKSRSIKMFEK